MRIIILVSAILIARTMMVVETGDTNFQFDTITQRGLAFLLIVAVVWDFLETAQTETLIRAVRSLKTKDGVK